MKKLYSLFLVVLLSFMVKYVSAQTSIHLYSDSVGAYNTYSCQRNVEFYFHIGGFTTGYNPATDTIRIKVFFGDGTDTTYKANLYVNGSVEIFYIYAGPKFHNYAANGAYDLKFKVIGPDNKADSTVQSNFLVSDNCAIIKGYVYSDLDNSCTYNTGDGPIIGNTVVNLMYGSQLISSYYTVSTDSSKFIFGPPTGFNYNLSMQNNFNLSFCQAANIVTPPAAHQDFGFYCNGNQSDLTGTVSSGGNYNPGVLIHLPCMAFNVSCGTGSGKLKLKYDQTKLTFASATMPYYQSGDTIIWNFAGLNNYVLNGDNLSKLANFHISTSAAIGDTLKFKLVETPLNPDFNSTNNVQELYRIVGTSYDPNDKYVLPQGKGPEGFIDNNINMTYTVTFQNTGTAAAENIYILDTIDSDLDINSFTLLNHSHNPQITFLSGNVVKINYPNINLPDSHSSYNASIGFVQYALRQKPDLGELTQIKNHAYIYFDYNAPIKTNTVLNTIKYIGLGVDENILKNSNFSIYPNPNTGIFSLQFENLTGKALIEVYNITGQLVLSEKLNNSLFKTIDLSKQAKGIYLVKVKTDSYSSSEKIVVE